MIRNAADRQPQLFDTGYDASVHEPIGRNMSLSWRCTSELCDFVADRLDSSREFAVSSIFR